jgi:excisionase family DNA binding protein
MERARSEYGSAVVATHRELFTVEQLAQYLQVHFCTVMRLLKRKALPGAFKIGWQWRFNKAAIDRWRFSQEAESLVEGPGARGGRGRKPNSSTPR